MDHRIFCLEILRTHITPALSQEFISLGGLRLLKKWLKAAEDMDHAEELRLIVTVLRTLPFDSQAIKTSEIGKTVKKLSKYVSRSGAKVTSLHVEIQGLMTVWTEYIQAEQRLKQRQLTAISVVSKPEEVESKAIAPTDTPESTAMDVVIETDASTASAVASSSSSSTLAAAKTQSNDDSSSSTVRSVANEAEAAPPSSSTFTPQPPAALPAQPAMPTKAAPLMLIDRLKGSGAPSLSASALPTAPSTIKPRERKPLDMEEGARKLLAMRAQSQQQQQQSAVEKEQLTLPPASSIAPTSEAVRSIDHLLPALFLKYI